MKKRYFFIMFLGALILAGNHMAQAQNASEITKTDAGVLKPQEVGNKFCPVTGEKIDEKAKVAYEYQGKIYNLCCPDCIEVFRNNPQKYIRIIEEENKNN